MKLSASARLAVWTLLYLGSSPRRVRTMEDLATTRGLHFFHLAKVIKRLAAADIVRSQKGYSGGYRLTRPLEEVTLLEVVEAVDGPIEPDAPYTGGDIALNRKLDRVMGRATAAARQELEAVRLGDLAGRRRVPK